MAGNEAGAINVFSLDQLLQDRYNGVCKLGWKDKCIDTVVLADDVEDYSYEAARLAECYRFDVRISGRARVSGYKSAASGACGLVRPCATVQNLWPHSTRCAHRPLESVPDIT